MENGPVRRFGEETVGGTTIRWGEVVKGVAIVAGVALVAVVAWHLAGAYGGPLLTQLNNIPIVGQFFHLVAVGAQHALDLAAYAAQEGIKLLGQGIQALSGWLGGHGISILGAHEVATATKGAQALAAGAAGAVVAIPAAKAMAGLHVADASTALKVAHGATEEPGVRPRAEWAARVGASVAYNRGLAEGKSHAEATQIAHDTLAQRLKSRNSSHAQQVKADREAIEAALAEPKRG